MRIVHVNTELKLKLESGKGCEALGVLGQFKRSEVTFSLEDQEATPGAETFERGHK